MQKSSSALPTNSVSHAKSQRRRACSDHSGCTIAYTVQSVLLLCLFLILTSQTQAQNFAEVDHLCGQGMVAKGLGTLEAAVTFFATAAARGPKATVVWLELGSTLANLGEWQLAERCLVVAERLKGVDGSSARQLRQMMREGGGVIPPPPPSISLEGGDDKGGAEAREHQARYKRKLYERFYQLDCKLKRLLDALQTAPEHLANLVEAAEASSELMYHKQGVALLQRAQALAPNDASLFSKLVDAQVKGCIFEEWDANFENLARLLLLQVQRGEPTVITPIQSTMYPVPPQVGLGVCGEAGREAERTALSLLPLPLAYSHPLLPPPPGAPSPPLRVAYVTSHFTSSSIGREMLFLLGAHDSTRVTALCFALNADEGSWLQHTWRMAIAASCSSFSDLSAVSDLEGGRDINAQGVHVVVDLNGWSGGNRPTLISLLPAPVQVNYKNWVASAALPALHFILGDKVVSPPEYAADYTEALVLAPNSYFISGHPFQYPLDNPVQTASEQNRAPGQREAARVEHGLARDLFLIANFNNLDKLEPRMWNMWTDIVSRHPHTGLWLQKYPPAKANRVLELVKAEGRMPLERFFLTGFFSSDLHIAIKALADIFVDNPTYNAHSTAMDTLWGALPLVTLPEEKMAARVGASLLCALGAAHTIARNMQDLAQIVERTAVCATCLKRLRERLERNRFSAPLFDTVRAVRNWESALRLMWEVNAVRPHVHSMGARDHTKRHHIVSTDIAISPPANYHADKAHTEEKLYGLRVDSAAAEKVG